MRFPGRSFVKAALYVCSIVQEDLPFVLRGRLRGGPCPAKIAIICCPTEKPTTIRNIRSDTAKRKISSLLRAWRGFKIVRHGQREFRADAQRQLAIRNRSAVRIRTRRKT